MRLKHLYLIIGLISVICLLGLPGLAAEKRDMGGWELNGKYNQLYDADEADSLKVTVTKIKEIVPLPGMAPGVALEIREGKKAEGQKFEVHLCPSWFMTPDEIGVKKGEYIKIKGVWAEIGDKDVFMASKIKRGTNFQLKLRLTKSGKPFWTMSPEELAKERAAAQE